ncbi:DUF349 domain-containing protein [Flavobacterium sp. CS20]|uniref:DUF349 domain-containing protein n=1 Tax=Flavobacterium sp. CS20 TaxID=2775246 RepID=UPI001B3A4C1D|nr:DUF349 domain-containing protein [Flavobacterium sp. CS20]QTY25944.1 DUF349 domain-containing protein [Flavobacterium sp. CS20]
MSEDKAKNTNPERHQTESENPENSDNQNTINNNNHQEKKLLKDDNTKSSEKDEQNPSDQNLKPEQTDIPDNSSTSDVSDKKESVDNIETSHKNADTTIDSNTDKNKPDAEQEVSEEKNKSENTEPQDQSNDDTINTSDDDEHHKEIDEANAEDSEDEHNASRHEIELKDYDAMSMDELVIELEKLLKKEKVQAIREHVTQIKIAFDKKFNEIIDEKKEQFIEDGGNVIDFHYSSPVKTKFNRIYFEYREKRDAYYKKLKKNLNENLKNRLALIEELKNMIGSGGDMKATFNQFKDLQERWKNAGPVPRNEYSKLWKTYHHHVERFYDFLHLDREFRDLDFQYNLDQKLKIIDRAEELVEEKDINRAFRELQLLHKMWKEEPYPVAKEYRDEIWDRFSEATKKIHDNRKAHFEQLDKEREKNLDVKLDIIKQIETLADTEIKSHKHAQKQIKLVQELRDLFFKAGRVPQKDNEKVWKAFKEQTRRFNRSKNAFYKNLKHQQNENLEKKLELIKIAEDNKDSDDFETTTPLMKKIQADWKKIGFVPRKHSDKIWKQFKAACNHYFDRFHAHKNEENQEEFEAFRAKKDLLDEVKNLKLKGKKDEDLKTIKSYIEQWKSLGLVPQQKKYIEGKFNKALDQLFNKMKINKTEAELLKYENRLQGLEEADDNQQIYKEEQFLRTKISDTKSKINQFENNLQFFSESDKESPLVKEVYDNIDKLKDELEMWEIKLRKIKSL